MNHTADVRAVVEQALLDALRYFNSLAPSEGDLSDIGVIDDAFVSKQKN